ncbi:MAG: DUF2490 domain-containing protein [Woeseia sp.]
MPHAEEVETSLVALGAVTFDGLSADFGLVEARAKLSPYFTVASGVAYLHLEHGYREVQVRASVTASAIIGRFTLEDRNLIYASSESVQRYRNRLRLTMPALGGHSRLSAHVYDEIYFDLDRGGVVRNNLALGLGASISDSWRAELYHVWSDNRAVGDIRYIMAMVSITFDCW